MFGERNLAGQVDQGRLSPGGTHVLCIHVELCTTAPISIPRVVSFPDDLHGTERTVVTMANLAAY